MPRFYLHLCDGRGFTEDEDGQDLPDLAAAHRAAVAGLREVLAGEVRAGVLRRASFVEIENEDRQLLRTVSFGEAVQETAATQTQSPN